MTDATLDPTITDRFVHFEGAFNVRDLGGLPTADGAMVRTGRIYRADSPADLTDADRARVLELDVGLVIDLRSGSETEAGTWAFGDMERQIFEVIDPASHPQLSTAAALPDIIDPDSFADRYIMRLEKGASEFVAAARALTQNVDRGVIFNCSAGKDRTGLLGAFVLTAVGVDRELVVADYAASTEPMRRKVAARKADPGNDLIDFTKIPPLLLEAPAAVMARTLDLLDEDCGGIVPFFLRAGFTADELVTLRDTLRR